LAVLPSDYASVRRLLPEELQYLAAKQEFYLPAMEIRLGLSRGTSRKFLSNLSDFLYIEISFRISTIKGERETIGQKRGCSKCVGIKWHESKYPMRAVQIDEGQPYER
jgi:hypothetical protein